MRHLFLVSIYLLFNFSFFLSDGVENDLKLELLQVIFRHGDRIPQADETYENDPYNPDKYEPVGYGQLTDIGAYRSYKLGQMLRQRYGDFVGKYRFNKVYAYSTDYDRTKASLQAVLAGLYPILTENKLDNITLKFYPIPTNYDKTENNFLIKNVEGYCPKFGELKQKNEKSFEIQRRIKKYAKFLEYLEIVTGRKMNDLKDPGSVYSTMNAVMSMNLPRPAWCSDTVLEKLRDLSIIEYDAEALTESLRRIIIGPTIEQFLKNVKSNEAKIDEGKKVYLYSAHDILIGAIVRAHNFTEVSSTPAFSSGIITEKLRGKDNKIFLRMFYWTGVTEKIIPLKFKKTGYIISFDDYEKIIQPILPRADDCF